MLHYDATPDHHTHISNLAGNLQFQTVFDITYQNQQNNSIGFTCSISGLILTPQNNLGQIKLTPNNIGTSGFKLKLVSLSHSGLEIISVRYVTYSSYFDGIIFTDTI